MRKYILTLGIFFYLSSRGSRPEWCRPLMDSLQPRIPSSSGIPDPSAWV